jgi:phosphate transport system ATP-binding protein
MTSSPTVDVGAERPTAGGPVLMSIERLRVFYGSFLVLDDIELAIQRNSVTALIGPSGCGKSTLLRTLNRMHETLPGATVEGSVTLDGHDIYDPGVDPVVVRRLIGMVFQRPNPFPTMSIYDNVASGLRLNGERSRKVLEPAVERALTGANLWEEVKDRLTAPATSLSGGQQQRLCIARATAVRPEVLLMDEPCSALDPISTLAVEDLIDDLKSEYTIVIVTHNMAQAARVSDTTAFFTIEGAGQPGRLVEVGPTTRLFQDPAEKSTADYIAGRFG